MVHGAMVHGITLMLSASICFSIETFAVDTVQYPLIHDINTHTRFEKEKKNIENSTISLQDTSVGYNHTRHPS